MFFIFDENELVDPFHSPVAPTKTPKIPHGHIHVHLDECEQLLIKGFCKNKKSNNPNKIGYDRYHPRIHQIVQWYIGVYLCLLRWRSCSIITGVYIQRGFQTFLL